MLCGKSGLDPSPISTRDPTPYPTPSEADVAGAGRTGQGRVSILLGTMSRLVHKFYRVQQHPRGVNHSQRHSQFCSRHEPSASARFFALLSPAWPGSKPSGFKRAKLCSDRKFPSVFQSSTPPECVMMTSARCAMQTMPCSASSSDWDGG